MVIIKNNYFLDLEERLYQNFTVDYEILFERYNHVLIPNGENIFVNQ